MKIEEGKYYTLRDGRKVGPMERRQQPHSEYTWRGVPEGEVAVLIFKDDGENFDGPHSPLTIDFRSDDMQGHMADAMAYAFQAFDFAKAGKDVKTEIADEAKRIVTGARRSAYGSPEQNFERIARFWQAYFENTGRGDLKITAADVSPMMRLMKEARLCETPDHRDSFVDLVGYTLTGAEVNGVKPLDKPVG